MSGRGRKLAKLAEANDLLFLNNGSPTSYRGTSISRCLDLSYVTSRIANQAEWLTDIETHPIKKETQSYVTAIFNIRRTL